MNNGIDITTRTYLIKFLLRIRGAFTAAPTNDDPVNQMPHAAPTIDRPKPKATPKLAYPYGLMCVNTSDHPALQYSLVQTADCTIVYDGIAENAEQRDG
jgi:hypothetical protein